MLRTNKVSKVAFLLEVMYKRGGVLKYPKIFPHGNGSDFKSDMTKLYKTHQINSKYRAHS